MVGHTNVVRWANGNFTRFSNGRLYDPKEHELRCEIRNPDDRYDETMMPTSLGYLLWAGNGPKKPSSTIDVPGIFRIRFANSSWGCATAFRCATQGNDYPLFGNHDSPAVGLSTSRGVLLKNSLMIRIAANANKARSEFYNGRSYSADDLAKFLKELQASVYNENIFVSRNRTHGFISRPDLIAYLWINGGISIETIEFFPSVVLRAYDDCDPDFMEEIKAGVEEDVMFEQAIVEVELKMFGSGECRV